MAVVWAGILGRPGRRMSSAGRCGPEPRDATRLGKRVGPTRGRTSTKGGSACQPVNDYAVREK